MRRTQRASATSPFSGYQFRKKLFVFRPCVFLHPLPWLRPLPFPLASFPRPSRRGERNGEREEKNELCLLSSKKKKQRQQTSVQQPGGDQENLHSCTGGKSPDCHKRPFCQDHCDVGESHLWMCNCNCDASGRVGKRRKQNKRLEMAWCQRGCDSSCENHTHCNRDD